jgi:hypothetical protein
MLGQLLLRNITNTTIYNWSLAFEYPSVISSLNGAGWMREIISREYTASVPNETASISVNWTTANQSVSGLE